MWITSASRSMSAQVSPFASPGRSPSMGIGASSLRWQVDLSGDLAADELTPFAELERLAENGPELGERGPTDRGRCLPAARGRQAAERRFDLLGVRDFSRCLPTVSAPSPMGLPASTLLGISPSRRFASASVLATERLRLPSIVTAATHRPVDRSVVLKA